MQWIDSFIQSLTQSLYPWNVTRATGIIAYLLLALSTLSGLYMSLRKKRGHSTATLALLHQPLGNWGLHLTLIHTFILLWDHYIGYTPAELLIPFSSAGEDNIALGLGIIGLYALAITILTSELRRAIGFKTWKKLHVLSPLTYVLATAHGLAMGADTQSPVMLSLYFGSIAGIILLLLMRLGRKEAQVPLQS